MSTESEQEGKPPAPTVVHHHHYHRRGFLRDTILAIGGMAVGEKLTGGKVTGSIATGLEKLHHKEVALTPEDKIVKELAGNSKYRIITQDLSPRHYRIFSEAYDALLALVPGDLRKDFCKPTPIVFEDMPYRNAHTLHNSLTEKGVVAIDSGIFENSTDAELAFNFGHEFGHWLARNHRGLAETLSGFTSKNVQPILRTLRLQIESAIPDKKGAAEKYRSLCEELIGDGIGIRLAHGASAGISDLGKYAQVDMEHIINQILEGSRYARGAKDQLHNRLTEILKQVDRNAITNHPPSEIRYEYMRQAAVSFGYADVGRGL